MGTNPEQKPGNLEPGRRGNQNGLSRTRQRQTRNPDADHTQNPMAFVAFLLVSGVDRRRRGTRAATGGKVRAQNSYMTLYSLARRRRQVGANSKQCCERDFENTKQRMPDDEGRPRFFRRANRVRAGCLLLVSAVVGPTDSRRLA